MWAGRWVAMIVGAVGIGAVVFPALGIRAMAQETEPLQGQTSTLRSQSTLVVVPTLVKTKAGEVVFTLKAGDFVVTDDGVPQKVHLEEDTDGQPLALVVVVQIGGDGRGHLADYEQLGTLVENMVGPVRHRLAVVSFDSKPEVEQGFTFDFGKIDTAVKTLEPGDQGAATLDALAYAVELLRKQPPEFRRAILLVSETLDRGSKTSLEEALRAIGDTNTVMYTLGFSSTKTETAKEAGKFGYVGGPARPPGPKHGCFSRDPDDPNFDPEQSRAAQDLDCLSMLLPPLRLVKMAAIASMNSLRKNVPETVADLTGGEYYSFKNAKTLERGLVTMANHVPNRYVLSFQPQRPHPGPHVVSVRLVNYPELKPQARTSYWVEAPADSVGTSPPK